jgi:alkylation response protein AidB-like acyl-CoA dehydrogenase
MKITKNKLKQLIKEELRLLKESALPMPGGGVASVMADMQAALQDLATGDLGGALEALEEVVEVLRDMVEEGGGAGIPKLPDVPDWPGSPPIVPR